MGTEEVAVEAGILRVRAHVIGGGVLQCAAEHLVGHRPVAHARPEAQLPGHGPPRAALSAQEHAIPCGRGQHLVPAQKVEGIDAHEVREVAVPGFCGNGVGLVFPLAQQQVPRAHAVHLTAVGPRVAFRVQALVQFAELAADLRQA